MSLAIYCMEGCVSASQDLPVPLPLVVYYMEGRDSMQLIYRWTKSLDPGLKKGNWAPEEDAVSVRALGELGSGRVTRLCSAVVPSLTGFGVGRLWPFCRGFTCLPVPSCRSCFKLLPNTGSRIGLKSGKRCQVGAMPSAEIGESHSAG